MTTSSCDSGGPVLAIASLNTQGISVFGSRLTERYAVIAETLEASAIDIINFQEVVTYYHLSRLRDRMPSFRHVGYRPSAVGPAGVLVTFSRPPIATLEYHRFPFPRKTAGLPWLTYVRAALKGTLVTRLEDFRLCVVNTHPVANIDGDWSTTCTSIRAGRRSASTSSCSRTRSGGSRLS
jgi:hypothetical protein